MDLRVSCAANRLASLARLTEPWRTETTEARRSGQQLGCLWGLVTVAVRGCSGGLQTRMMGVRPRRAGGAYANTSRRLAARLGQAEGLARFLEENVLLYDVPMRCIWMTPPAT